ncbi:tetratricopeptide repeat protein [Acidobacteria bacterium AH-259-A15]|nr:tetratricopeptide repeat protein [Acidobacteria bacterium AH-259-A15]
MFIRLLVFLVGLGIVSGQTAEEYINQTYQLVLRYQWEEAVELLKTGLDQYPDQPELLLQLGSLLVRSGQVAEGEKLLQRALEIQPGNSKTLRSAGEAQLRRGYFSSAIALLRESLANSSGDAESHHRLAFALLARGQEQIAVEHARRAVELNPLDPRFRRLYALLLEIQREDEKAYEQLKFAYRLAPRDPKLLFHLSERRRVSGNLFQALEYLELAAEVDPENPLYHDKLSDLYDRLGEKEKAMEEAQRARSLGQAFEKYITAIRLSVKGKKFDAIRILQPVIKAHPEFVTGMMLLGDLYQKSGRESQALDLYLKILERDPFQSSAREKGAWLQVQQGLLDSALQLLEDSGFQTPNHTLIAGYHRMIEEDWAGALKYFRKVEAQNPLNPDLLQLISYCLNAKGQTEEALLHLAKAERLRPDDPEIELQMREIKFQNGLDLLSGKKWRAALEAFQELMKDDVQAEYLLRMAYCRQQLGDLSRAAEQYRVGLESDPTATWARINFATCLSLLGKYREAAGQWELILTQAKTSEAYYQLGLCYSHLSRFPEAEYAFEKAIKLGDERPEVLYNLGVSRLRAKKLAGAWHLIRRSARAGYPPAQDLLRQARRQ